MTLERLGWNQSLQEYFNQNNTKDYIIPGRVIRAEASAYRVYSEQGECNAVLSGKYRYDYPGKVSLPVAGDWVSIDPREDISVVTELLPRHSTFSRKVTGDTVNEQVIAANIDTLFIVMGMDRDFKPSRVERYLTQAWDSGAKPVIILNKSDLAEDPEMMREQVEEVAWGVPVITLSALEVDTLNSLVPYLDEGITIALVGSSGVGKTTLINSLKQDSHASVNSQNIHGLGRHTTTQREMFFLEGGAILIDTPGMRELQLWTDEAAVDHTFEDIVQLSSHCRYRDCSHVSEPGCAVQAALEDGSLKQKRYENYMRMHREAEWLAERQDKSLDQIEKEKWKQIKKDVRQLYKYNKKYE